MTVSKLITYNLLDLTGKTLDSEQTLEVKVSDGSGNYLVHKDLVRHLHSQKQNTVSTKTRSEVRGGGRKPWRQKGTGRARAGSNRSPLWRGGGVIFGPKPKQTNLKSNKKERGLALQTLLYNRKNSILVIDNLETVKEQPKTKTFLSICQNCKIHINQKVLVVVSQKTPFLKLSTQNLKNIELISVSNLNTLSLLKAKQILFTKASIHYLEEKYRD